MSDLVGLILQLGIFAALLGSGFLVGRVVEAAHFRRLKSAEAEFAHLVVSDLRTLPTNWQAEAPILVSGAVVVATDYFKVFVAGLRSLVGGNVRGYETLIERARREAVVRMLREADRLGANAVWNVRIETSMVGGRAGAGGVEALAYGTALQVR